MTNYNLGDLVLEVFLTAFKALPKKEQDMFFYSDVPRQGAQGRSDRHRNRRGRNRLIHG